MAGRLRDLDAPPVPEGVRLLAESIGSDPLSWAFNCHAASHAIVQSGIYPGARVARGFAHGVPGQHSWVVADYSAADGVYDFDAHIIDATLWSYDLTVTNVWQGTYRDGRHQPHGQGVFWQAERPHNVTGGEPVTLAPEADRRLSVEAREFLTELGPLDHGGWMLVAKMPVRGWPSREVIEAMDDTPALSALVPIDILGHLTDRNPGGLYMRTEA